VGIHSLDRRIPVRVLNYCWHRLGWPPIEWITRDVFDVVHSPHPLLIPTARAARVVTIHDLDFLDHPDRAEAEIRRDYQTLVRTHARDADHVIVPSHFTKAEIERRLGIPSDRITVCPNGAPDWTPRQSWPEAGHILFVGTLAPRKNIGCLLDAYRLLLEDTATNPPPLVLAGPPTSQAADWLAAIEAPPFKGHVRCTGYLDTPTLKTLYEGSAVLVLPSWHEGFGLPVVEAMTVGVPVVVSDRGALPEVAGRAGLIIDPLQPTQLAGAIDRMLKDERFSRACVERGFQQAAGFSWKRSALALRTAYEHAYNRSR
jgi:glycosyltransferase involved in cell wall biosynthesis